MLSRESASDSNDIDQTFKLTTKQYNAGKSDILYSDTATLFVCGSSGKMPIFFLSNIMGV